MRPEKRPVLSLVEIFWRLIQYDTILECEAENQLSRLMALLEHQSKAFFLKRPAGLYVSLSEYGNGSKPRYRNEDPLLSL